MASGERRLLTNGSARSRTGSASRRPRLGAPLGLLLIVALVYANSLGNGFHFDDWHAVEENPAVRSLANVPIFFTDPHAFSVLRSNTDLRPVLLVTFAVNYALTGRDGWSYHLLNVLLHWGVVVLVFRVVRDDLRLGADAQALAWTAAVLMAVHPLATESVNYVSARSALLVTFWYVASFDAAVRGRRWTACGLAALAMLTKMIAATLPVMVLAHARLVRKDASADGERDGLAATAVALALVAVAGIAYRVIVLPPAALNATHDPQVTPWIYALTSTTAYVHYLRQFVWPDGLVVDRADYPLVTSLATPSACASIALLAVLSVAAWRVRRAVPTLAFAWTWYLVTLLPEQSFFPLAEPVNDHRPYLALPGLVIAAAVVFHRVCARLATTLAFPPQAMRRAALAVLALALGFATVARNRVWGDDYLLWIDATRKAPRNGRAWLNAGQAALNVGRLDEADGLFAEAHRLAPCYAFIQLNQSVLAARRGQGETSIALARAAVECQPELALARRYLGDALARAGRSDEAGIAYREAIAIDDRLIDAWSGVASVSEAGARWADAAAAYDRIAALDPTDLGARMSAGVLRRVRLGDPHAAAADFRAVLARDPEHYGARFQLALALYAAGDVVAARAEWRRFERLARAVGASQDLALAPPELRDAPAEPEQH